MLPIMLQLTATNSSSASFPELLAAQSLENSSILEYINLQNFLYLKLQKTNLFCQENVLEINKQTPIPNFPVDYCP